MKVKVVSKLEETRGNSWYFENPTERVYFEKENPTPEEVAEGEAFAQAQYEKMGWSRCFLSPPQTVVV